MDTAERRVEVSRPDKVLFPDDGITKADLAEYHARIAEVAAPHLRDRPLALRRFPDGIGAGGFFQKDWDGRPPEWVRTVPIERADGEELDHVIAGDAATLVWLADRAAIELHGWLARSDDLHHPDQLVVDLDPSDDDIAAARSATRRVRDLLDELGLGERWLKTSGSKGYHVHVPLDRSADFDTVRSFARRAMELLARRYPDELTTEQRKAKRAGRTYLDVGRNAYGQTAVAPYTVRAHRGAPVATPIDWHELGETDPQRYTIRNLFRRLGQKDDPWTGFADRARSLTDAQCRLDELLADTPPR
ncbi:MAG: non-homologous end-joining DNA ligase [Actinobacteria bacterium]|nr:non-homologous end-joining DNA ligase [Actinomycetota bacterium]